MKIVAVTSRFPFPIERGDKLRAYYQLRELGRRHDVALVAINEHEVPAADMARLEEFCTAVEVIVHPRARAVPGVAAAVASGRPAQVGYFRSRRTEAGVRRFIEAQRPDHVYCQLLRTAWAARDLDCGTTIDFQDAFTAAARRRAAGSPPGVRQVFEVEAGRIGRYEAQAFGWFDHHVVISDQDRDLLEVPRPEDVVVLPNGVDTAIFDRAAVPAPPDPEVADVVFVGNMGYPPNVAAAEFLAGEVMPLVRRRRPGARLVLAGARPAAAVQRLAGADVEVTGFLDDIRTAYVRGRVMVAPLFMGAGLQNKVLEAMAMGVPVVTSELVNNAIGAAPGTEIEVAGDAAAFAHGTLSLLEDPARAAAMAGAAHRFVSESFSWRAVGERLEAVLAS